MSARLTLDEIRAHPERAATLSAEARAELLAGAFSVIGALAAPAPTATATGNGNGSPAVADVPATRRALKEQQAAHRLKSEYLSIQSLASRIPYDEQTIRNLMGQGVFKRDVHYVKPQGTGRPIFKWSAVQAWLEGRPSPPSPPLDKKHGSM